MTNNSKIIFRNFLFALLISAIIFYTNGVFFPKWKDIDDTKPGIEAFYNQPENTIDAIFLGTSSLRNGISPLAIWEASGIPTNLRATVGQHPIFTYYYTLEALRYQDIKVVVVDGITLFRPFDVDARESSIRKSADPMRLSMVKLGLIKDILYYSDNQTAISYLVPLLRYHSRWEDGLTREDFEFYKEDDEDRFRGQYLHRGHTPYDMPDYFSPGDERLALYNKNAYQYFLKLIDLCEERQIDLVFLTLPRAEGYSQLMHNGIQDIADEYGLQFFDYNLPALIEDSGFDPALDFQNATHLNVYGRYPDRKAAFIPCFSSCYNANY